MATIANAADVLNYLGYDGAQPGTPGVRLAGNPTMLKETVRNLLDNAINYTPSSAEQPGVITARVLADPFGHVLMVQVEDSGPGIPEGERELVLQTLARFDGNRTHAARVLGLSVRTLRNKIRQYSAEGNDVPRARA